MAEALLQAIVSGLAVGGAYALVALGFSITFTTTKTLNFSHGEFVSAGAFIGMSARIAAWAVVADDAYSLRAGLCPCRPSSSGSDHALQQHDVQHSGRQAGLLEDLGQ